MSRSPLVAMPFLDTSAPPRADHRSRSHPRPGGSVDHPCGRSSRGAIDAFQPTAAARSPPRRRPPQGGSGGEGRALGRPPPPCEPLAPPHGRRRGAGRGGRVDAQADMPLDEPRAQVAFKDSMIRGILQFTLRIAFRCVLHRCKSQDIRC